MTIPQKVGSVAGIVLIVNLFVPWYGVDIGPVSANANAFDAGFLAWGGSFLAIFGAAVVALKASGLRDVTFGSLKAEQIGFVLGGAGAILVVLRWLTETSFTKFGLFLGILAAVAVAYGAFGNMKESGIAMPGIDDFRSIGGKDSE